MPAPSVSVVVVNYNGGAHLQRCLAALQCQTFTDFEAIVVDNGSQDGAFDRARVEMADARFRFVALGSNLGFAAANNRAAAEAQGLWLALLNPDAFAEPDWLQMVIDATKRHPDVAMFGSTQIDARDPMRLDGTGDHYFAPGLPWRGGHGHPRSVLPKEREVFGPCAAAALYRADLFRALGGFDERFFCYCEDVDFAFRARLAGHRCVQVPAATVHHIGGGIAGHRSAFARYHGTRNLIWTFIKDMPAGLFWPLLPIHALMVVALIVESSVRGDAAPVLRGVRDALAGLPQVWRLRRQIQSGRVAGLGAITRALSWNPLERLRRAPSSGRAP